MHHRATVHLLYLLYANLFFHFIQLLLSKEFQWPDRIALTKKTLVRKKNGVWEWTSEGKIANTEESEKVKLYLYIIFSTYILKHLFCMSDTVRYYGG